MGKWHCILWSSSASICLLLYHEHGQYLMEVQQGWRFVGMLFYSLLKVKRGCNSRSIQVIREAHGSKPVYAIINSRFYWTQSNEYTAYINELKRDFLCWPPGTGQNSMLFECNAPTNAFCLISWSPWKALKAENCEMHIVSNSTNAVRSVPTFHNHSQWKATVYIHYIKQSSTF